MAMKFVLVNQRIPRTRPACAACSGQLQRGYLHDLSSHSRYCGIECYSAHVTNASSLPLPAQPNPFELVGLWSKLTVEAASTLFDCASVD
jgi:hypothetical protein